MKPNDRNSKKPMDNKMQLQELQMHRHRADVAEKAQAVLKAQLEDLKRATPVEQVQALKVRDALVALLATVENIYLDKNGKFMPEVNKEMKLAMTNARLAIKPPSAVKVEAPKTEAVVSAPASA